MGMTTVMPTHEPVAARACAVEQTADTNVSTMFDVDQRKGAIHGHA